MKLQYDWGKTVDKGTSKAPSGNKFLLPPFIPKYGITNILTVCVIIVQSTFSVVLISIFHLT